MRTESTNCTTLALAGVQCGMKTLETPLLTLGGGNMAYAIISGALQAGLLDPQRVGAIDPNDDRRALFPESFGDAESASDWLKGFSGSPEPMVLLAVKPQMLRDALGPLVEAMDASGVPACTFVSILAGTRIGTIAGMVRAQDRVIRVMPNTPAQIGQGMSAVAIDNQPDPDDLERVRQLFESVGKVVEVPESLMDAFTAVAGSGPAYLFYLAEGMMRAAEAIGFDRGEASTIVRQTILGSAMLLDHSAELPGELRTRVTSKNGTTYAATTTLDAQGVMDAIVAALTAARDRGVELASEA